MKRIYVLMLGLLILALSACGGDKGGSKPEPPKPTPKELTLSTTAVELKVGSSVNVSITQGNGAYAAKSSDSKIATANISGSVVSIKGVAEGTCNITVTDTKSNKSKNIAVKVTTSIPDVSVDVTELKVEKGETGSITIKSGSGEYEASVSPEDIATVTVEGNTIKVTAEKAGDATITIKDKKTGKTITIKLQITETIPDVEVDKAALSLKKGESGVANITAGSGEYTLSVDKAAVASATLSGNQITIKALGEGTAIVTVKDNKTEKTAQINVTVTLPIPDIAVDKTSVVIKKETADTFSIIAGSGEYALSITPDGIAMAELSQDNIVTVTGIEKGEATITITDKKTNKTALVKVTVTEINPGVGEDNGGGFEGEKW